MGKISLLILGAVYCALIMPYPVWAIDYGLVTEKSGDMECISNGKKISLDIGTNLNEEDEIELKEASGLIIVSYEDCREWSIKGPGKVKISKEGLVEVVNGKKDMITWLRQLPLCYSPAEVKGGADSHVIGGFVMRGKPGDPMEPLRKEFTSGKAGNSTLITLIMHDIKNKDIEKARAYFMELKKREPGSSFIQGMEEYFK